MISTPTPEDVRLIVPVLHHRLSGVSTTAFNLFDWQKKSLPAILVFHRDKGPNIAGLWRALKVCRTPTRNGMPRIWHARRNYEMFWGLLFKNVFCCRLKLVATVASKRRAGRLPRFLVSRMDAVIATSPDAASLQPRVHAIAPHGVDCDRFHPPLTLRNQEETRTRWGLGNRTAIGIFGRNRPEKGTDLFVEAMIRLLPRYPQFQAVLVGLTTSKFSEFEKSLKEKIAQAGLTDRFTWLGEVPYEQIPEIYQAMSLVVAPPRYEGFGVVPLEAMATGVPVVASRAGEYESMIRHGETGWLCRVNDLEDLVGKLDEALSLGDQLPKVGALARDDIERRYSLRHEGEAVGKVYEQLWAGEALPVRKAA